MTKSEKIEKIIEILKRLSETESSESGATENHIKSEISFAPEISIQDKAHMTATRQ